MKAKNYKNVITLYDIVFKKNSVTEFYFLIPFPSSVPYEEVRERELIIEKENCWIFQKESIRE